MTPEEFKHIMSQFATGITVVTALTDDGAVYGITVNSFASVSLEPLLVLICLDDRLSGISAFRKGKLFGVSILGEDQEEVSRYFARRGLDRSEGSYVTGDTGIPLIQDALGSLECEIVASYPGGDHTIFVGEVRAGRVAENASRPLLYFRSQYRRL